MLWLHNDMMGHDFGVLQPQGQLRCVIPRFPLAASTYQVGVQLALQLGSILADDIERLGDLHIVDGDFYETGYVRQIEQAEYLSDTSWSVAPTTKNVVGLESAAG